MNEALELLPRVAYFSMEIAVDPAIPAYSGGLGVLAGDMMRSAADLAVPLIGVTLASRRGYFRQEIVGGVQLERPQPWEPERFAQPLAATVLVHIGGRDVRVGAWRYSVTSHCSSGRPVPVLLLDTDRPENHADDCTLTHFLYGGDDGYRLRQEMVLGIGGVRMLAALGVQVRKYHLNEGHAAFLTLELLRIARGSTRRRTEREALATVRGQCVFTTHTPVPAGHDQYPYAMALPCLQGMVEEPLLRTLAGTERFTLGFARRMTALDGWWLEGCVEGITGWAVGDDGPDDSSADALSLYRKLEERVLPLFHGRPAEWNEMMRRTIAQNGSFFNSHRMVRRYVLEAYSR